MAIITKAWDPAGRERQYQMCRRCVMDTTDPEITFDADGVCSHCRRFEVEMKPHWKPTPEGAHELEQIIARIKAEGQGKRYDCVIGLSGGVDSSYLAVKVVEWGLRPLVVHVDAGWNSELAVKNIEQIVTKLGLDLVTCVVDWEDMKELHLSFLSAGLANQDVPQDHAFFAALYKYATDAGIRHVISGANYATEGVLPQSWGYDAMDATHVRSVHRKFGTRPLKNFPIISLYQYYFYFPKIKNMEVIAPLNYMPYEKATAVEYLENNFGWRYYGGKHYESRWTRFFQAHYLPTKFGYDKRKAHLSSLIVSGQLSRDEALKELEGPLYSDNELADDKAFVAKKLGIDVAQLERFIAEKPHNYTEFPTNAQQVKWGLRAMRWTRLPGLVIRKLLQKH